MAVAAAAQAIVWAHAAFMGSRRKRGASIWGKPIPSSTTQRGMKRPSLPRTAESAKRPTFTGRLPAELDDAARLCALHDRGTPLEPSEVVRLREIAALRGVSIPQPWSTQRQCGALAASVGPPWSSATRRWADELAAESSVPERPFQGDERRPVYETAAYGPGPIYQESLPPEMQRDIMFRLAETDLRSALDLASVSRTQRTMLESIPATALGASIGLVGRPGVRTGTGYDYARALAAMGAGNGRTSAVLAEALCLMQAFARYVFSNGHTVGQRAPLYANLHPEIDAAYKSPGGRCTVARSTGHHPSESRRPHRS